jgi:hypothetical protein
MGFPLGMLLIIMTDDILLAAGRSAVRFSAQRSGR